MHGAVIGGADYRCSTHGAVGVRVGRFRKLALAGVVVADANAGGRHAKRRGQYLVTLNGKYQVSGPQCRLARCRVAAEGRGKARRVGANGCAALLVAERREAVLRDRNKGRAAAKPGSDIVLLWSAQGVTGVKRTRARS